MSLNIELDNLQALGKVGKVMLVHFTGDIHVAFGGQMWTFNPECCVPAPESELTPDLGLDGMGLDQLLKGWYTMYISHDRVTIVYEGSEAATHSSIHLSIIFKLYIF